MIKIYHHNRCRKSREGLQTLKELGQEFEIIDYISNPLGVDKLTELIAILNIAPESLIRKSETIWKSDYKGKELSDNELIQAMVKHPKLIERPIVIRGKKGVIGRPNERILNLVI